jgi:hypothetical protein
LKAVVTTAAVEVIATVSVEINGRGFGSDSVCSSGFGSDNRIDSDNGASDQDKQEKESSS